MILRCKEKPPDDRYPDHGTTRAGKIHGPFKRMVHQMKPAPLWLKVLEKALPITALLLCNWAMESARDRGRQLPGGKDPA